MGDGSGLPDCPVCGQRDWANPWRGTTLRRCPGCGTLFNHRSEDRIEEEARYRASASVTVQHQEHVAASQWRWARALIGSGCRSVLDVGCGFGHFLIAAREDGAKVAGLEIDPTCAAACRENGIEVCSGSLFDTRLPDGPWGLITLWDVLDHLEDPHRALGLLTAALAPGGTLIARGRNAAIHGALRRWDAVSPRLGAAARIRDFAVVHRWGFRPEGWSRLLHNNSLLEVRLHAGIPTPGDRYGASSRAALLRTAKSTASIASTVLRFASAGRLYPYPSVLVTGVKGR